MTLEEEFSEFLLMRKSIKKKATDHAIKLLWEQLGKLSNGDTELAIAIIQQSTVNNWLKFYPLKEDFKPEEKPPVRPPLKQL